MKRRSILLILVAACGVLMTGALAACRQKSLTLDDLIEDGYTCEVTIDFAGGLSGNSDRARTERHQYAKAGSLIVEPGANQFSGAVPTKEGYTLKGYYRGEKQADGTIVYGEQWNFSTDKVTGDLTLYAAWLENYSLVVHYGDEFERTYTTVIEQNSAGEVQRVNAPSVTGYTMLGFYPDRASAERADAASAISFPNTPTEAFASGGKTWEIWADSLEGSYAVVGTKEQFTRSVSDGTNVYLTADIDFGGEAISFMQDYTAIFLGNGHTLSNFTVKRESQAIGDGYFGLFNRLAETVVLQDVSFTNFTLEVKTTNENFNYYIGGLAGRAAAGSVIRNVTLQGIVRCTLADPETEVSPFIGENEAEAQGCDWTGVTVIR